LSSSTPAAAASHAGHAADAATPRDVVLGTLEMSSSDAHAQQVGPRLRWTRQLHERFVRAVAELGGTDKATPKSVMRAMAVPELTLHHLKSPLQKYRLAVSRGLAASPADNGDRSSSSETESQPDEYVDDTVTELRLAFADDDDGDSVPKEALCDSSRSVAWMQREVQRNLHEQIEVQRHLQLRIEAQGRYLQSVLRRAQEVLADHNLGSPEAAMAELSELASAAASTSSSLSLSPPRHRSADSCVTSSSSSEAESKAGAKRLCTSCADTRECTVEQPVSQSKRGAVLQQVGAAEEEADAENGSSEIDLNR
ncbi:hypothetical protein EJB05_48931, partial [Eragrostis curvula]